MRVLRPVVEAFVLPVLDGGHHVALGRPIARQLVGDHDRKRKPTPTFRRGSGLSRLRTVACEAVRDGCERVLV